MLETTKVRWNGPGCVCWRFQHQSRHCQRGADAREPAGADPGWPLLPQSAAKVMHDVEDVLESSERPSLITNPVLATAYMTL